jgi:hypothetical protein
MKRATLIMVVAAFCAMVELGCGGKKVTMNPANSVPAAQGHADISHDSNGNTVVDLKVHHLAKPEMLTPPGSVYVVWFQPNGQPAQNQGQLRVDGNLNGEFKTTTPLKNFDIVVTAEPGPTVTSPTGSEIMRQHVSG